MRQPVPRTLAEAQAASQICADYVRTATEEEALAEFWCSIEDVHSELNYRLLTEFPSHGTPISKFEDLCGCMIHDTSSLAVLPYQDFLRTGYWLIIRNYVLERRGSECAICGSTRRVNVHHRTYDHHGLEHLHLRDLIVLCNHCHAKFHDKLPEVPNG